MKKRLRVIACVMALVLVSALFCGCRMLEDMESLHAVYIDNDTVLWNGIEYKRLPACERFSPEIDYTQSLWITTEDVPTLLLGEKGDTAYVCHDGMFLKCVDETIEEYLQSETDEYYGQNAVYYCLDEVYERIVTMIEQANNGVLEYTTYTYSFAMEHDASAEWMGERYHILSLEQADTFVAAITSAVIVDAVDEQLQRITEISVSTADQLFFSDKAYRLYRLTALDGSQSFLIWDMVTEAYYAIDAEYTLAFADMFAPVIQYSEGIAEWETYLDEPET